MTNEVNVGKTILIIDDTVANIKTVLNILHEYDVIPATSGEEGLAILQEEKIDLILLDIMMPEMDGFEVCRKIKSVPQTSEIPIIFLTAKNDEDSIEQAYVMGGSDYVTKPFLAKELLVRVKFHLKYQEIFQELEYIAHHDTLTGIYNRRKFFEMAHHLFNVENQSIFTMMIDIDHFKKINDLYGHAVGDETLKQITQVIASLLPPQAYFGRIGGEEFAIILTADSVEQVMKLAEHIRITVAETRITVDSETHFYCSISNGISQKYPDTKSLDELLMDADRALYQAKENGRNRSIFRTRD